MPFSRNFLTGFIESIGSAPISMKDLKPSTASLFSLLGLTAKTLRPWAIAIFT